MPETAKSTFIKQLTQNEFDKLSQFINFEYGIKMPAEKKTMLQCRLQKRLRELNIENFSDYIDLVFSDKGKKTELIHMIDVVTTNKTDFFREPAHFDFLLSDVLPELDYKNKIKIWSAGCSSGEEPYTLAIVLMEYLKQNRKIDFHILGTDISSRMLIKAANGIYTEDRIFNIPLEIKKTYFLRSKDRTVKKVKVIKELRSRVSYQRLNFIDHAYEVKESFDIIFCRNVLIYFDRPTQEKVINRLCQKLNFGGYFFLGHSESIMGMRVPLKQVKPTIYQKI